MMKNSEKPRSTSEYCVKHLRYWFITSIASFLATNKGAQSGNPRAIYKMILSNLCVSQCLSTNSKTFNSASINYSQYLRLIVSYI